MPAEGTIFYSWATARERAAFELLVTAVGLALEDVAPTHYKARVPVRFWIDDGQRGRISELARYNGVSDSTVFRLVFTLGLGAIEKALGGDASRRPVRMENGAAQW